MSPNNIRELLIPGSSADADVISEIKQKAIQEICTPYLEAEQIAALTAPRRIKDSVAREVTRGKIWLLQLNDKIEGYVHVRLQQKAAGDGTATIEGVYLRKKAREVGLDREALAFIEEEAKKSGCYKIKSVAIRASQAPLYQSAGYYEAGPAYKQIQDGVSVEFVPMAKTLNALDKEA